MAQLYSSLSRGWQGYPGSTSQQTSPVSSVWSDWGPRPVNVRHRLNYLGLYYPLSAESLNAEPVIEVQLHSFSSFCLLAKQQGKVIQQPEIIKKPKEADTKICTVVITSEDMIVVNFFFSFVFGPHWALLRIYSDSVLRDRSWWNLGLTVLYFWHGWLTFLKPCKVY